MVEFLRDYGKTALIYRGREISYAELIENVKSFARAIDVLPGDRVAIVSENRPEWIYALFGTWRRGGIVVPIDFMATPSEIEYILRDSEPRIVFCSKETEKNLLEALSRIKSNVEIINFDRFILPSPWEWELRRELDEVALLPYTSGTTGTPKGVMLTFGNLFSNVWGVEKIGLASKEDSVLAILPFHHTYPFMTTLLLPLYLGATIVFLDKLTPEDILEKLRKYRISFLVGVPRLYQLFHRRIMEEINKRLSARLLYLLMKRIESERLRKLVFKRIHNAFGGNIKFMVSGGAKLPVEVARDFFVWGFKIIEGYGLTETSPIVSFNPPNRIKLGSVGIPIEGVQVRTTEEGEIIVKGPNVMKGYWNRPEETQKVIIDGWLYTGDLGSIDEEGYIYITGRKKELIVLGSGKNVFPEELEDKILQLAPYIKEVGVFEKEGKLLALIYPDLEKVKEYGITNLYETIKWEVIDKLNRELPEWKRIVGFKIVSTELPKTRLGKLRRFLLPKIYEEAESKREVKEEDFSIFETPQGKAIKEFLEKLSFKEVKPSDHIELDLGLDSLAKVELLGFIEKNLGITITEEELAKHITVKELIELLREKSEGGLKELKEVSWKEILSQAKPYELHHYPLIYDLGRLLLKLYFKLYHRLEVKGIENLPSPPFIIAPNHESYLDGFAISASLPKKVAHQTYFLGEETFFRNPISSLFARLAHVITVNVNKGLKESLKKTAYALGQGKVVVIFPEGARTRTGELMEFKKGVAILSRELGVPMVPTAIIGAFEAWSIYDRFPKPHKIKVVFGEPIYPDQRSYEEITKELYERVKELKEKHKN